MPWKDRCAMDERTAFIADVLEGVETVSGLCQAYGVSRKTGHKWILRYEKEGAAGLVERSRAPIHCPHAMDDATVALLLDAKTKRPKWGPLKILHWMCILYPERERWPATSSVAELFDRHGLVSRRRRRACASPTRGALTRSGEPNHVWTADHKGWFKTRDGLRCEPLTLVDDYSRFLLRCVGLSGTASALARPVFEAAFREFGLPRVIRSDNGAPFSSIALLGLSYLSVWWIKLGIVVERIEPAKPQQNGRHERMHKTLKLEMEPVEQNLRRQQRALARFRKRYNEERPHQALGGRPPGDFYSASPRPYPARIKEAVYDEDTHVRRVDANGDIKWRNNVIFLSKTLTGERVGLKWIDDRTLRVYFVNIDLAKLDMVTGRISYVDGRKGQCRSRGNRKGKRGKLHNL